MGKVLTTASTIKCSHQGTVSVSSAGQSDLQIDGNSALVVGDLVGVSISGCTNPSSSSSKQCATTTSMIVGDASTLEAGGKPVLLDTATGLTDSIPPGTWSVSDAGQSIVEAT
jgi:hypothetical protein